MPGDGYKHNTRETKMILPSIHINGTSRGDLFDRYMDAMMAVEAAIDAVAKTWPHGRDYYPQGDDALQQAQAEHQDRLKRLHAVALELNTLTDYTS
jgi:hypothetical protein